MKLTQEQITFFRTFGFLRLRQHLTPEEIQRYRQEFEYGLSQWPDSRETSKKRNHYAVLAYESTPFIAGLLDDDRFADVAEQLLGKPVLGVTVNGSIWYDDTDWHPDVDLLGFEGIRFAIYLEPLQAENGALRMIPGSHKEPLFSAIGRDSQERFGIPPQEMPGVVCESEPGDVIVFHLSCWHGAFGGEVRRQGAMVFFEDPQTPEVEAMAIDRMQRAIRRVKKYGQPSWFTPYWQSVDDPRHQGWVRRIREMGLLEEE